jgi:hypothetical protein
MLLDFVGYQASQKYIGQDQQKSITNFDVAEAKVYKSVDALKKIAQEK